MTTKTGSIPHGPFRVDQLREGDRYELSNGHPIYCAPSGRDHSGRNLSGGGALETDPDVEWAGVDAGFTPTTGTLPCEVRTFLCATFDVARRLHTCDFSFTKNVYNVLQSAFCLFKKPFMNNNASA